MQHLLMADMEVDMMKDVPGYKVVLKAVIKNQIQQLVEQLAVHTDVESVVLTASVADGTLSHLGSKSGKGFLDDNDNIKSQFLGYCFKNKHRLVTQNTKETQTGYRQIQSTITEHVTSSLKSVSAEKHRSNQIRQKPYDHGRISGRKSLNPEQRKESMLSKPSSCSYEAESLSEVQDTVCDSSIEIKVERLDNFEDTSSYKERPKAKNDEMFLKGVSEIKPKDKNDSDSERQEINKINPQPHSEISIRSTNCPQGIDLSSCLANLDGHSNDESQKRSGSSIEMIQKDDTYVKVEEISESELQVEKTDVKSLETQAKQKPSHPMDMTFDPQVAVSRRRDGNTVLSPSYGTTQQSHSGQILVINMDNQKVLPEAQHVKSAKYAKMSRFVRHSSINVNESRSNSGKGIGIRRTDRRVKKNTKRSIRQAADTFRQFLSEKGEDINFEIMQKNKLAKLLSNFYLNVRTKDGQLYRLKSISQIRLMLSLYLRYPPFSRKLDIIRDNEFADANKAYKAAIENIKASGKGVTRHHPEITDKDLLLLFRSNELNPSTPSGLQNRVQMTLRLTFSLESNAMESMKKDAFKLAVDSDGTEYIYKSETSSSVGSPESTDVFSVKLKEMKNSPYLCPVKAFKKYLSKLNPTCERLWQYPKVIDVESEAVWYRNKALRKYPIEMFMSRLSKAVPLSRIYTNNSIRKTGKSIIFGDRRCLEEIMTLASMKNEQI